MTTIRNIQTDEYTEEEMRGDRWRYLDLSGEHLGVRVELIGPGEDTSYKHFHTLEEEHVIMLDGALTLLLGDEEQELVAGDHVAFLAGDRRAHHLVNRTDTDARILVFGERKEGDVVVYPDHQVMMIKALEFGQYTYRPINNEEGSDD